MVTGAPVEARTARAALSALIADLDDREASGQIEILDGDSFYDASKPLPSDDLIAGLTERAERAVAEGFKGLRTNGNCAWVDPTRWADFQHYELLVQQHTRTRRMICMCSYHTHGLKANAMIDVMDHHDIVLRPERVRTAGPSPRSLNPASLLPPASDAATMERWLQVDQAILDALPIGFCCCDSEGRIVRVNRRATELWGRPVPLMDPEQRFCGSFRLEDLAGRRIPKEENPMARAARYGESFEGLEAVVQNPDEKRWVVRFRVAPLRDRFGQLVGAVNCFADVTAEYELRLANERHQRTFDLAMVASQMGTWRYTLVDNVCVYDENAQRLYGLTGSRFLHDEQGVKEKFHPDDIELMWSRVRSALDPEGPGRYEIEYRVKQLNGSWRWLSAWGIVEFEGQGSDRKPLAISGASRDLSDTKKAEELERLLVNELNHRVKNTIATVQAIVAHTLRHSNDVPTAREALYPRLASLARIHDLLTQRN